MSETFDLVVIGAGPGGYVAAIRAAQNGLKVACVEKRDALGGTCLNVGCIPSKALLHGSHLYEQAQHHMADWGVTTKGLSFDLAKLMAKKNAAVDGLTKGIAFLLKKNKVTHVAGAATISAAGEVTVALNAGGTEVLKTKNILIATGSEVASLPGVEIDETVIVSSTGALALPKVPKKLIVIGGGVIGLELGSVWRRLGTEVTVLEYMDRITPEMDGEVAKNFSRILTKQGMAIKTSVKVTAVKKAKSGASVTYEPAKGGDAVTLDADVVLMSVGRKAYTDGLGLDALGVKRDARGRVEVGHHTFESSVKGIYAIGDVIIGPMLAHKAEDEGVACADHIAGKVGYVNHAVIPGVIYTQPEVAAVGRTEEQLKADGVAYKVGKFPFAANSRAKTNDETEGFVKILADAATDRVLGCHMIGVDAGNMIQEAVTIMEFDGTAEDIALACHAHPTHTEAVKEAALAVAGMAIHI